MPGVAIPAKEHRMRYLLRRLGFYLVALWAALTLNFLIPRLMPGDPVGLFIAHLQGHVDPRAINALRLQFGITNDNLWVQYGHYLRDLVHGNMGLSISYYLSGKSGHLPEPSVDPRACRHVGGHQLHAGNISRHP